MRIAARKYASDSLMLSIYNVLGEAIYSSPINSERTEIDLSARPNGVYTLHILSAQETIITKIIISK
ncbi:MAG: T9SS type A sorting domain-containing protein [Flavobacteriales bacterium]|nr:T9SS type A sorting domain-containing protein [Flavobacteriales bacterium]